MTYLPLESFSVILFLINDEGGTVIKTERSRISFLFVLLIMLTLVG